MSEAKNPTSTSKRRPSEVTALVTVKIFSKRVSRRDNLDRYYLVSAFGFAVFLHRIHHDDPKDVFHSHPWNGLSLIFGSYTEEKFGHRVKKTGWNLVRAEDPHRVELPNGPVWTLFFHGRRFNRWMVVARDGTVLDVEPWRGIGWRTSYWHTGKKPAEVK